MIGWDQEGNMKQEDISVKFSHVIKMLRKKESLKQVQLAEIMGIDRSSISNYENGNRTPPIEFLIGLSEHFNVSVDFLIKGKSFHSTSSKTSDSIQNELMAENVILIESILDLEKKISILETEKQTLEELTKAQSKLITLYK